MTATRGKAEDVDFKRLGIVHGPSQRQRAQARSGNQAQNETKGQSQIKRMTNSNTRFRKPESAPTTRRPNMSGREWARNDTPGSVGRAGTRGPRTDTGLKSHNSSDELKSTASDEERRKHMDCAPHEETEAPSDTAPNGGKAHEPKTTLSPGRENRRRARTQGQDHRL